MTPKVIIYYAVALFFPIALFTVFLNNYNEDHPFITILFCIGVYAAAGWLSSKGMVIKGRYKWVAWSSFVGLIEGIMLYFMA